MSEFIRNHPSIVYIISGVFVLLWILRFKWKSDLAAQKRALLKEQELLNAVKKSPKEKPPVKGAFFNFSGHMWDAYEVFGLTSECTQEDIESAYEQTLKKVENEYREFVDIAYKTIVQKNK